MPRPSLKLCLLLCLLLTGLSAQAATIDRIEPANWWVGMQHNRVELLVHSKGIATATPRLSRAGVAIIDVQTTDSPNYLFVTVEVAADAKPGEFAIEFIEAGKVVVRSDAVPNPVAVRYAWRDAPVDADLANSAGLPASPFRSDAW